MADIITFNYTDYLQCLDDKLDRMLPKNPINLSFIDRSRYQLVDKDYQSYLNKHEISIEETLKAIENRVCDEYYQKVYTSQMRSLDYSVYSFPAYRFIMSEVLADDWLAIADFHKKHCRDHAIHQPLVAYITAKLLGFGNPSDSLYLGNGETLLSKCVNYIMNADQTLYLREYLSSVCGRTKLIDEAVNDNVKRFIWTDLFYETAIMSAMFHDIGYPWQYINRLSDSLHSADFVNHTFADNANYIWRQFHDRLLMYPFYGYMTPQKNEPYGWGESMVCLIKKSMEHTHGFPGAIGFLYMNDIIRKYPCKGYDAIRSFCIDWAAMAIMMHDMIKVYRGRMGNGFPDNPFLKIRLDTDPLSWVVSIADFLEEFERPSLSLSKNDKGTPEYDYYYACNTVTIQCVSDLMKISMNYCKDKDKERGLFFKKKETREYFDPTIGYIDITSAGLSNVELECCLLYKV